MAFWLVTSVLFLAKNCSCLLAEVGGVVWFLPMLVSSLQEIGKDQEGFMLPLVFQSFFYSFSPEYVVSTFVFLHL